MKRIIGIAAGILLLGSLSSISAQDFLAPDVPAFRLQSRFTGGVEFCAAPSRTATDSTLVPITFNIKAGYRFKSTYISGLLGIEYMNGENFIPLGVELRQNFSGSRWTPFAYAQTGYSFHLKRNIRSRYYTANYAQYDPSFFIRTGFGFSYATTLSEFYISIGYLHHALEKMVVESTGEIRTDLTMNGIDMTLGFAF